MSRRIASAILPLLLLPGPALTARVSETSETYTYSTYIEQADGMTVLVDSFPASLHDGDPYFPLHVAIGVRNQKRQLDVTTESFTLIDSRGQAVPAASPESIRADYGKRAYDDDVLRSHPLIVSENLLGGVQVESNFYPYDELGIRAVHLSQNSWFQDVIYFPRPTAGLGGVLTLKLEAKGMEAPIEVRLRVPRVHGDHKSD